MERTDYCVCFASARCIHLTESVENFQIRLITVPSVVT